ncbi:MAG: 23S rRNA (adenine(2503)-C(2))-methyltransferase RlmN [Spirochaetales bacterium]|nr:23S rRNA (adenine(2503)-C(2))-methyltransferase RlmN [Spirochaetales bacterium]
MKNSLAGLPAEEIIKLIGIKEKYRGRQLSEWIIRGAVSFDEMSNLPAKLRTHLTESFSIFSSTVISSDTDNDSTGKIGIKLFDDLIIEAVLLKDENGRKTACLSSQVGCAMGCVFCRTGKMGLRRNLNSCEIIEQFLHLRNLYGDISNIVFMGMGEPLKNVDEVLKAISFFTNKEGFGMSQRRVTVSTCGVIDGIIRLKEEAPVIRLAVSLVTADEEDRIKIMPVTRKNSLENLKMALIEHQKVSGRRITLECAIIKGINDTQKDAAKIADWAKDLSVNVNVIPWNPASEIDFEEPSEKALNSFCKELEKRKIPYSRRYRRGRGLNAACGQLATNLKNNS